MTAIAASLLATAGRRRAPTGAWSLGVALFVAGCGADHAADQRRMIAALSTARDQVCACGDLGCADAAEQALADYLLRHVDRLKKIPPPRVGAVDPIATKAAQLDGELRACKQRLEEAARAS
jgi:hypothetical protein